MNCLGVVVWTGRVVGLVVVLAATGQAVEGLEEEEEEEGHPIG